MIARTKIKLSFKKELLFVPLVLLSALIAGIYGILHDQLTYSISPEYYFRFKFDMFGIPDELHNRVGASMVGFMATWWMGLLLGTVYSILGYLLFDKDHFFGAVLRAVLITLLATFMSGLIGLAYGAVALSRQPRDHFPGWFIPDGLLDYPHYIMVGSMHNWGYLGALMGLFAAVVYMVRKRNRLKEMN